MPHTTGYEAPGPRHSCNRPRTCGACEQVRHHQTRVVAQTHPWTDQNGSFTRPTGSAAGSCLKAAKRTKSDGWVARAGGRARRRKLGDALGRRLAAQQVKACVGRPWLAAPSRRSCACTGPGCRRSRTVTRRAGLPKPLSALQPGNHLKLKVCRPVANALTIHSVEKRCAGLPGMVLHPLQHAGPRVPAG